ncbi:MAG: hypothetical protein IT439_08985 [Phycisphaerales bacterium]|nr:hypothetical protein [Phycisphaerales bacterium]
MNDRSKASPALWASAFVIGALVLSQSGRMVGSTARAEMVSQTGAYTVLTVDGGTNNVLVILDKRSEELFVYNANSQSTVQLETRLPLPKLFTDARQKAKGN